MLLIEHKDQVIKRERILEDLWGENDYFLGRSMDVFVARLRKYLKPDTSISLDTIRGVGIILAEQNATKALEVADRVMVLSLGEAFLIEEAERLTTEQLKEGYRI